jgi:endonuclease/exonuclease/phosphatase (EEP) superfamily protein YafD
VGISLVIPPPLSLIPFLAGVVLIFSVRRVRRAAVVAAGGLVVTFVLAWLLDPAVEGYHIGSCNQTDYAVANQWVLQNVGTSYEGQGRVLTLNRVFAWCKADENPSDYPNP